MGVGSRGWPVRGAVHNLWGFGGGELLGDRRDHGAGGKDREGRPAQQGWHRMRRPLARLKPPQPGHLLPGTPHKAPIYFSTSPGPVSPMGWAAPREQAWQFLLFFSNPHLMIHSLIVLEEGKGRNIDVEKHQLVASHNPGMCPDWDSNLQPFVVQDDALTESPGQGRPAVYTYRVPMEK